MKHPGGARATRADDVSWVVAYGWTCETGTSNDLRVSADDFWRVEANDCPMSSCAAPAGSPCRTGRGKVAAQYHTARFRLVPALAKTLSVPVPPVRKPGSAWTELPRPPAVGTAPAGHARFGAAPASAALAARAGPGGSLEAA